MWTVAIAVHDKNYYIQGRIQNKYMFFLMAHDYSSNNFVLYSKVGNNKNVIY